MASERAAALMVNTGTPAAPNSGAVWSFLRRFLSDPRVVELPRPLWLPLLYGLVLPLRAPRSARKYREIWRQDDDEDAAAPAGALLASPLGSPLLYHNSRLREALARELISARGEFRLEQAFLYSAPRIGPTLERLRSAGVRRLIVLPLFPQASGSTTGAVYDQVAAALRRWRALPELRFVSGYSTTSDYIGALASSVREHWSLHGRSGHLLMSFHGIPLSYVASGDRYADECQATAAQLAAALDLQPQDWSLSYQSRFGANRWLAPATDRTLAELPRRGVRIVTVICPGFACDCLETLEEIALRARATFLSAGGERFDYIRALNARSDHARALAQAILHASSDWA